MQRRQRHVNNLLQISKNEEITAFVPEASAIRVAEERTGGMVRYFWELSRGVSMWAGVDYVQRLANSAYLQGVNDAAVSMAMTDKARRS